MIYAIIILTVLTRFLPHPENFAPITAIAIFAAAYLPKKQAVVLPLAARFISDIFLGFFSWPLMVAVYVSHLAGVLFGLWIRGASNGVVPASESGSMNSKSGDILRSAVSLGSTSEWRQADEESRSGQQREILHPSAAFGSQDDAKNKWARIIASPIAASVIFFLVTNFAFLYSNYPHNLSGILQSYANALPFFLGTLLGDLTYTLALFGIYEFAVYLKSMRVRQEA